MNSRKVRLDQTLVERGLVFSRSQAESYIKLGVVQVNDLVTTKPGQLISDSDQLRVAVTEQYVSRAALKLDSVAKILGLRFKDQVVMDVGSSTGGFTDYALRHGARKVVAVEIGTNQMHSNLRGDSRIELHEQTDIRELAIPRETIGIVLIDVSFVSLRDILPAVAKLVSDHTSIVAMVKPQFEAAQIGLKHKGVIKNDHMRRDILKDFESWVQKDFIISQKADSSVKGSKGNQERFYLLKPMRRQRNQ